MNHWRRLGLALLTVALIGCGADSGAGSTTSTMAATTTTTVAATTTATAAAPTSTTLETTTSTGGAPDLPGEPIEFGPAAGDTVAVIGVAHNDTLNLRSAPGATQGILKRIPPLYDSLTALGETRQLPGSMWIAVDYEGTEGWVNLRYIGYIGDTTDATASIIEELGETPAAQTMLALGLILAESLASDEPPSDIVLSVAPTQGDLGEVTYDVIGLGDDAVRGLRAHVFGTPEGEGFVLRTVEVTSLCGRGVDDGACV